MQQVLAWIKGEKNLFDILKQYAEDNECFLPREMEDEEFFDSYDVARQTWDDSRRNNESMKHKIKLNSFVKQRWVRIKDAVCVYEKTPLGDIPELDAFEKLSAKEFPFFMNQLKDFEQTRLAEKQAADLGLELQESVILADGDMQNTSTGKYRKKPSRYDNVWVALNKLGDRNLYSDQWTRTLVWKDNHERSRAFADGRIIEGTVTEITGRGTCLLVEHDMLRVRAKEELTSFVKPTRQIKVVNLQREGLITKVWITGDSDLEVGDRVAYGPRMPDPNSIVRSQITRRSAYKKLGWTHNTKKPSPVTRKQTTPSDLLNKVNGARTDNI